MERIASFCVDHTVLEKGLYVSRQDGDVTTYDIRMRKPNGGDYLQNPALHTFEHLGATYLRNSEYKDNVIYFGPMGCRTGFYFLSRGLDNKTVLKLLTNAFEFIAAYEGDIPGASEIECGNFREQDLDGAKADAKDIFDVLSKLTEKDMFYK